MTNNSIKKYFRIPNAELATKLIEVITDEKVSFDDISYPDDELKQYIVEMIAEDLALNEPRQEPYNTFNPEENFRRRILLCFLAVMELVKKNTTGEEWKKG